METQYKIFLHKNAEKFIKQNKLVGAKFIKAFDEIRKEKNLIKNYDIKKLKKFGYDDIFRLRIGKYRAIFRIIEDKLVIFVIDIDSRGGVYK